MRFVPGTREHDQLRTRQPCEFATRPTDEIASSSPWITRVGTRAVAAASLAVSSEMPVASFVAAITSGLVSSPMERKCSICPSESGSVKHWEKKKRQKAGQSSCQNRRFHIAQPTCSVTCSSKRGSASA